ncbi:hypothetical protein B0H66DRAFT_617821 [Apodospora peruviana]|uniref:WW domain-containing protein n=1 Tax=Apodospora peruviana TaxID=516989 RepID=A0AAE0MBT4_9PEZI|nr:hypothetical protein B0H66DRAFT_617821 [Apodospora peruviana]
MAAAAVAEPPPPTYEQATSHSQSESTTTHNGRIPLHTRRSMEDELRPLPERWVREYDPNTGHQFFVDTVAAPPRAIWHHPYDDDEYLSTLSPSEREAIRRSGIPHDQRPMTVEGGTDEDKVDEGIAMHHDRPDRRALGRKLKDNFTGTTHEQRAADRSRLEEDMYRQHQALRKGMQDAMSSGNPQLLGRDGDGRDVYLEPPGHTFPEVVGTKPLSPYMTEVFYDTDHHYDGQDGFPGQQEQRRRVRRFVRPGGEMYGYGYGGYDCGRYGGGRWGLPGTEYGPRPMRRDGGGGFGFGAVPLMAAPLFGGMVLGGGGFDLYVLTPG